MAVRADFFVSLGDGFGESLLDAVPDATVVVDGSGQIVVANDHAEALFGFELVDLLGRPVEDLVPEGLAGVHRAHRTRYRADPSVRSMGAGLEPRARRPDGSDFPVEISLSPLRVDRKLFTVATVRDVSARVAAEEQLHRVITTLDASQDAVFIFDAETLRYSFVNLGAVRMVGYDRDELLTMTPLHLNPYTDETSYRQLIEVLLGEDQADSVSRQSTLIAKDGREIPVEKTFRSAPAGRDGTRWIISLARDITDRLATEAELRQSQDELREAEQRIALAADRERIARDLHDTVIQRIFGEGLSLHATLTTIRDQPTRARIESTIEGLDSAIKDLRSAIFSLQTHSLRPDGLRGQLLDVVNHAADALGFEPRLQFDGPIDSLDDSTAADLVPVLREALSNIAQHANAHHVRIAIAVTDDLTLTVADDGDGMPTEVLGGNGLSNMAHRARALGGNFTIAPQPAGGSILTWHVPAGT